MKIIFFEVANWEKKELQSAFPEALFIEIPLTQNNIANPIFKDGEIISTFINSTITKSIIDQLPQLKYIATRSTGYDHIDYQYCQKKGILVANVPEYGSNTVAEHTFALILSLTKKIYQSVNQAKNLKFEHDSIRGIDLYGKTIGIVGLGKIGINVMRIALGFNMKVLAYNRSQNKELKQKYSFEYVDLDCLLQNSDIISLHLPLTPETHHIINKNNITLFKKGSYLINTARGGLIETEAIILGLEKKILAGVGLDVLEGEKELNEEIAILTTEYKKEVNLKNLVYNHILINHPKVIITLHNAFNSKEALARITNTTIENIKNYLAGKPSNIVR